MERPEEIRKELEYCERVAAERVQRRYKRHFAMFRDVAAQIIDLVTMVGEYRLLNEKYVTQLSLRMQKGITTVNQCKRFFKKGNKHSLEVTVIQLIVECTLLK